MLVVLFHNVQGTEECGKHQQLGCEYIWHVGSHVLQHCLTSCNGTPPPVQSSWQGLDTGCCQCGRRRIRPLFAGILAVIA